MRAGKRMFGTAVFWLEIVRPPLYGLAWIMGYTDTATAS